MSLLGVLHKGCHQGKHVFWPPWHRSKRCLLCGCFDQLHVGPQSVTLANQLLTWSTSSSPTVEGELGLDRSLGRPRVYVNGGVHPLAYLGESGIWTLIYSTDLTSATMSVNMSGLNGNSDELYVIIARVKGYAGGAATYSLRPNGFVANQRCTYVRNANNVWGSGTATILEVGRAQAVAGENVTLTFFIVLHSSYSTGGTTVFRSYFSFCGGSSQSVTGTYVSLYGGAWADPSTNMTSITFYSTWSMQIGSSFRMYRIENG